MKVKSDFQPNVPNPIIVNKLKTFISTTLDPWELQNPESTAGQQMTQGAQGREEFHGHEQVYIVFFAISEDYVIIRMGDLIHIVRVDYPILLH